MREIIPAILPKNYFDLEVKVEAVHAAVRTVQIDVCDGRFTPRASWPYGRSRDGKFSDLVAEKRGLPFWDELTFELDMMVTDPFAVFDDWISAGIRRFIVHLESVKDFGAVIERLDGLADVGLALGLDTPVQAAAPFIAHVAVVQCMGIAKIGFQGQPFDSRVADRVRHLRETYPELTISVDGGVSLATAPALLVAGADRLVVGSAIFESDNIPQTIAKFKDLA